MPQTVCIVAPRYIASTPRVVKEADALSEAGYVVHVVHAPGDLEAIREHGDRLIAARAWHGAPVGWARGRADERWTYWKATVRQRALRLAPRMLWPYLPAAEVQAHRMYPEVARRAAQIEADLYIGHYPAGLAAAAYAAQANGAAYAYDAEDFHVGESPDDAARIRRIDAIERALVPGAAYVTAASDGIARALQERYAVPPPVVVYNAFPWHDRASLDGKTKDRQGRALSLYWFSQVIGLRRGLQDAIRAAGRLDVPVQLHLRGSIMDAGVRGELVEVARRSGVADSLHFHEQVSPDELLSRAAEHDIGLALEQGHSPNNALAASNKMFFYPLAGLAVAATDVPGQRIVLEGHEACCGLYPPGDDEALAGVLRRWTTPEALRAAKQAALEAARGEWNWEREAQKVVDLVGAVFHAQAEGASPTPAPSPAAPARAATPRADADAS